MGEGVAVEVEGKGGWRITLPLRRSVWPKTSLVLFVSMWLWGRAERRKLDVRRCLLSLELILARILYVQAPSVALLYVSTRLHLWLGEQKPTSA